MMHETIFICLVQLYHRARICSNLSSVSIFSEAHYRVALQKSNALSVNLNFIFEENYHINEMTTGNNLSLLVQNTTQPPTYDLSHNFHVLSKLQNEYIPFICTNIFGLELNQADTDVNLLTIPCLTFDAQTVEKTAAVSLQFAILVVLFQYRRK